MSWAELFYYLAAPHAFMAAYRQVKARITLFKKAREFKKRLQELETQNPCDCPPGECKREVTQQHIQTLRKEAWSGLWSNLLAMILALGVWIFLVFFYDYTPYN